VENKKLQKVIKRLIDIIFSLIVFIVLLPIWIIVAILIKVTSPGPVFFLQDRPGQYKKIFKIYKFRTMRLGSEKMVKGQEVLKDDDRITSIGKFLRRSKIDEIPQVLNVLKGEMSLVGPRPERIASLEEYDGATSKRLNMRPGMTGLAQVSGNIYLDLQERYKFDVYYVDNYSLWLDVKIILRTVGVVLFGEDRYINKCLIDFNKRLVASQKETTSI
jgi:undecaprenyl phosphate N,N'-diacetylbacillosamine 1-phosphate transferase